MSFRGQRFAVAQVSRALAFSLAWLVCAPSQARADAAWQLSWHAHASCPDAAWAEQRIRDHLGRRAPGDTSEALHAKVELTRRRGRFALELHTSRSTTHGTRSLSGTSCAELAEAAVLIIVLAIDQAEDVAKEPSEPNPSPPTPSSPASDTEKPPGLRPSAVARAKSPLPDRAYARLSGLADVGSLPRASWGGALAGGIVLGGFRLELSAAWWQAQSSRARPGVRVGRLSGLARACHDSLSRTRVSLGPCLGLSLAVDTAEGLGQPETRRTRNLVPAAEISPRLRVRMTGRLWLTLSPELHIPLKRYRFVTLDTSTGQTTSLHTPSPVSGGANLGVEVRF
jgi:hypothetical protein